MRNKSRLQRLEKIMSPVGIMVMGIPPELDDRIPTGCYGKIVNAGELIIQTKKEHLEEIDNSKNIIRIGDGRV